MLRSSLWVALPSASRRGHQWTCQECCFWHGHPRSLSGAALDPFYHSGEAEESPKAASAIPDTLWFWLSQNCNKIHIYLQHTTLAASPFTEQLSTGEDVKLHLQKHPAKSPLMRPPLFNWHQTHICHLQVTSPGWPLRGWAVINLLKCWVSRRDPLNSQAFYFITEDFMCLLQDEFCSWVSDLNIAQG